MQLEPLSVAGVRVFTLKVENVVDSTREASQRAAFKEANLNKRTHLGRGKLPVFNLSGLTISCFGEKDYT